MLNKNTQGAKRQGQSEAAVIKYIAILATKSFDIKLRPRISQVAIQPVIQGMPCMHLNTS